jgi:hypothetical protein
MIDRSTGEETDVECVRDLHWVYANSFFAQLAGETSTYSVG